MTYSEMDKAPSRRPIAARFAAHALMPLLLIACSLFLGAIPSQAGKRAQVLPSSSVTTQITASELCPPSLRAPVLGPLVPPNVSVLARLSGLKPGAPYEFAAVGRAGRSFIRGVADKNGHWNPVLTASSLLAASTFRVDWTLGSLNLLPPSTPSNSPGTPTELHATQVASGSTSVIRVGCSTLRGRAPTPTVRSANGRYVLAMQGDGNLVLRDQGKAIWNSGTVRNPGAYAVMQGDGNFVVRSVSGRALWNSGTRVSSGMPGTELTVQDDGNAVIRRLVDHVAVWASGTRGK